MSKVFPTATAQSTFGFEGPECCSDGSCCYAGYSCTPRGYSICCPFNATLCRFGIGSCCNAGEVCLQDAHENATCWHPDTELDFKLNGITPFSAVLNFWVALISVPRIYLAEGILDCGPRFYPDQCAAYYQTNMRFVQEQLSTEYATVSASKTVLIMVSATETRIYPTATSMTVVGGQTISLGVDYLYETDYTTITTTYFLPGTFPELIPTKVAGSIQTAEYTTVRNFTESNYAPSIVSSMSVPTATLSSKSKRSYDAEYNRCDDVPDQDLNTNSLIQVCHFVANLAAGNRFVSLKPTAAAYMPSWIGYFIRALAAIVTLRDLKSFRKPVIPPFNATHL